MTSAGHESRSLLQVIRRSIGDARRKRALEKAFSRFRRNPVAGVKDGELLGQLVYGWGNEGWSAQPAYLRQMVLAVSANRGGDVLECGSGLSTVLLAATAAVSGGHIYALEHVPEWAARVRGVLDRFGLSARATIVDSPLKSYGDFWWYTRPSRDLRFAFVIADGPPSDTPGGRYGLVPVMRDQFSPGCEILLDDAHRADELAILERWSRELGVPFGVTGADRPFGVITVTKK